MIHPRPLVFLLVHGIGPQNAPFQEDFLCNVRKATRTHLEEHKQPALMERLVTVRADWSHLYKDNRCEWLETLFPESFRRAVLRSRVFRMLLFILAIPVLVAVGTGVGMVAGASLGTRTLGPLLGWIVGTALGLLVAGLVGWRVIVPRFPWGHLWTFGRSFEANTVSDIILYESDAPREAIIQVVLDALTPLLSNAYAIENEDKKSLPVVLAGHSLGCVVVYDTLLGISAHRRGQRTSVERQLDLDDRSLVGTQKPYLQRVQDAQRTLCPLGMVTMGSPIALFLFRKPELTLRRDLWTVTCPPMFSGDGTFSTRSGTMLRWKWRNFWHAADFVAHRLEPLFNQGYGGGKFVEDVEIHPLAEGPVDAHSTYWTDPHVINEIGQQLADALMTLP